MECYKILIPVAFIVFAPQIKFACFSKRKCDLVLAKQHNHVDQKAVTCGEFPHKWRSREYGKRNVAGIHDLVLSHSPLQC